MGKTWKDREYVTVTMRPVSTILESEYRPTERQAWGSACWWDEVSTSARRQALRRDSRAFGVQPMGAADEPLVRE